VTAGMPAELAKILNRRTRLQLPMCSRYCRSSASPSMSPAGMRRRSLQERIIREAGKPEGHMVVARTHPAEFEEATDLVENVPHLVVQI
jgi:hypothetical protein